MHVLLAHGGTLCPEEMLIVAGAASLGFGFWCKYYWHRAKVWVGFRLIARHLRHCHGECNFVFSYAPGKGVVSPQ